MKREYDFSRATRGPIAEPDPGKTRITIRIDNDVLQWFRAQVHERGGGNYQSLMNAALRDCMARDEGILAETLRYVLREEMAACGAKPPTGRQRKPRPIARSGKRGAS